VRVLSQESLSPESWDAIVVGPGWGTDDGRKAQLERLLSADTALILDADAVRLFARIVGETPARVFKAPLILTPHPGEFRDLAAFLGQAQTDQVRNASETVRQSVALAQKFGLVLALRASTTHVAFPDGSCAVFDGSASGLGIAGSGDVLSGLAGGLLARWIALSREPGAAGFGKDAALFHTPLARAILGAVLVHGIAGRRLSATRGWFTPADLAQACGNLTSGSEHG
jgi:NAD(P)H-hydrate repair Nnr-like enzyme with NAD(P)H-hydrate dehydratase domain